MVDLAEKNLPHIGTTAGISTLFFKNDNKKVPFKVYKSTIDREVAVFLGTVQDSHQDPSRAPKLLPALSLVFM